MAHVHDRLLERYGVILAPSDTSWLRRTCDLLVRTAAARWVVPLSVTGQWLVRVPYSGLHLALVYDARTKIVVTALPPEVLSAFNAPA